MAHKTGDGPRYFGSADGCTFSTPNLGNSKTSRGSRQLNPKTSKTSGLYPLSILTVVPTPPGSSRSMPGGTSATMALVASRRSGSADVDGRMDRLTSCLLYTSDAADDLLCVDL